MSRPKLTDIIKKRLVDKGLTINKLAKEAGNLSPSTLRSWINRNKFTRTEWKKIAETLDLPLEPDEVGRSFVVEWAREISTPDRDFSIAESLGETTLSDALKSIEAKFERLSGVYRDFGEDVKKLFRSMQAGDAFCYISLDEIPYEMTPNGWYETGKEIVDAVRKGARFVYLFPSSTVIGDMLETGLLTLKREDAFTNAFGDMCERVKEELGNDEHAEGLKNLSSVLLEGNQVPFLNPGHKYVCFVHREQIRALARFPTGTTDIHRHLHVPLDMECTSQLVNFINKMLKKHGKTRLC